MRRTVVLSCAALAIVVLLAVIALAGCAATQGRGESGKAPSINVPTIPSLPAQLETAPPPPVTNTNPKRYTQPAESGEPPAQDSAPPAPVAEPSSAPSTQPCPS